MSVLILNVGASQLDLAYTTAREGPLRMVGATMVSFAGAERNAIRAAARTFTVTTSLLDATTDAAVRAAIGTAAQIPCKGDLFNNSLATVTCSVRLTDRAAVVGTAFWQLTLAVSVVAAS